MGVLIAGLEMEKEIQYREGLAPLSFSELTPLAPGEVLLGRGVARILQAVPGEKLPVVVPNESGFISGRRFVVKGIFSTPGLDPIAELFIYMNLSDLQSLLGLEKEVGHLVLFLRNEAGLPVLMPTIEKRLQASGIPAKLFAWDEIGKPFLGILDLSKFFLGLTNLLVIAVISLTIVNSTLMNLFQRMPGLGALLALGTQRRFLFLLLSGEFVLLGLVTLPAGLLSGWLLSWIFSWQGLPALNPAMAMAFGRERLFLQTTAWVWILSFGIPFSFLLAAAGFPILRACRMNLSEVLKES
jgi:ABC-type lipoprotein release transport system permease subunit